MKRKKILTFIVFILYLLLPLSVFASDTIFTTEIVNGVSNACINNYYYEIQKPGSSVIVKNLTINDINGVKGKYPSNCYCSGGDCLINGDSTPTCKSEYSFKAINSSSQCKITQNLTNNYKFMLCPGNNVISSLYEAIDNLKLEYDANSFKYKLSFPLANNYSFQAKEAGKVTVTSIDGSISKTIFDPTGETLNGKVYSNSQLKSGIYYAPGTEFYLLFYLSSGDACNGSYVAYYTSATSTNVPNPVYSTDMCKNFRNKYAIESDQAKSVYICYQDEVDFNSVNNSSKINSLINNTKTLIDKVEEFQLQINSSNPVSTARHSCVFEGLGQENSYNLGRQTNYVKSGTYFRAQCTETATLVYDDPVAVKAGMGFEYNAKVVLNRSCVKQQISYPVKPAQCSCHSECWGGQGNHEGTANGGPNEDFDACVLSCDNGKYTQSCIDSCYDKVYENSNSDTSIRYNNGYTKFSLNLGFNNFIIKKQGNIKKVTEIVNSQTGLGDNCVDIGYKYGKKWNGNHLCSVETDTCGSVSYEFSDYCNGVLNGGTNVTTCNIVLENSPCVKDAEAAYQMMLAQYNSESSAIDSWLGSNMDVVLEGDYKLTIDELYSLQKNGNYLTKTTTYTNKTDNKITSDIVTSGTNANGSNTLNLSIGNAYLNKVTDEVIYTGFTPNTSTALANNKLYLSSGNKYYTQMDTKIVNDFSTWPTYFKGNTNPNTDIYTKNIHLTLKGLGTWNEYGTGDGFGVDCFYGTGSGIVNKGLDFVFRPITLTDMFPNGRNARYNWSDRAKQSSNESFYSTTIDPVYLMEDIQTKGSSIYDSNNGEVDYEFVLTKENIRNIKSYNKHVSDYNNDGQRGYLDYNMSCYTNNKGYQVCTSKFLDNIDGNSGSESSSSFITYSVGDYTIDSRKSIIGCNNAIKNGTMCGGSYE